MAGNVKTPIEVFVSLAGEKAAAVRVAIAALIGVK